MKDKLTVELFGILKEICKTDNIIIEVELPINSKELIEFFIKQYLIKKDNISQIRVAVNNRFLSYNDEIKTTNEIIMLIPPVGGG